MPTAVQASIPENLSALPMPTRPLGPFNWQASVITMGGVKWDTDCTDAQAVALLHRAMELGINTFDTAYIYGDGESERKLGLAMQGVRHKYWVNTKVIDRTYDGAMRMMETSLKRLQMDYVDLMFVHSVDSEDHRQAILGPNSVLKAVDEMRRNGHVRHIGVSGHWVKHVMKSLLEEIDFEAVLFPVGIYNEAYGYSFLKEVLPTARAKGMAVLGMKVYAAGRVKHCRDRETYLRFSLGQDIDTAVLGMDTIAQLEENVRIAKTPGPTPTDEEVRSLYPEALAATQQFDPGEFEWVSHYKELGLGQR
jgi:aryl-alcohol dehydrogenase-like predicted oxidoreductase